jgi:hypothetical protein
MNISPLRGFREVTMTPSKNTGRLAGLLSVLAAVTGGFGLAYVRSKVIVPTDAAATAANLMASVSWFRAAIVGMLLADVFLLFLGLTLFHLFKEVNKRLAIVLLVSVMMTVSIAVMNTSNHFGAIMLLSGAEFLKVFTPEQLNTLALFLLRQGNGTGQGLLEIFWTPYYFSFGLLVFRSRYIPRVLGVLLMMMAVGFAINILQKFLIPQFHPLFFTRLAMSLGAFGGIPTMLWLLIKGARVQPLENQTS